MITLRKKFNGPSERNYLSELQSGKWIPILDGFRGIAVLLVVFYHYTSPLYNTWLERTWTHALGFGWMGVDLFFVLSGFLITGILFDSKKSGNYFKNFYMRRVLRIFPLFYAFLFIVFILVPLFSSGIAEKMSPSTHQNIFHWFYLSNFVFILNSWQANSIDVFWQSASVDVLWSLAIEEQFYLIWPMVVLALRKKNLIKLCLGLIVSAFLIRHLMHSSFNAPTIFVLTPARMDGLAIGGLIALLLRGEANMATIKLWAKLIACICGSLTALIIIKSPSQYPHLMQCYGFSLASLFFGSMLVLGVLTPRNQLLSVFLQSRVLISFGKYSYGLYLIHQPVRQGLKFFNITPEYFSSLLGSTLMGQLLFYVVSIPLAFGVAIMSFHLFEKHFLSLKKKFQNTPKSQNQYSKAA